MEINEFRRVLTCFADEPSDVDVRLGKVVAQVRDELIDAKIAYSATPDRYLQVTENDQTYPARMWLVNRIARLPQLADRILSSTSISPTAAAHSPFVVPSGYLSADLAVAAGSDIDVHVTNAVDALLSRATDQTPGATSVLYLTSDAGEGKTTIINRAARVQAERYKSKTAMSLIVPIPLSGRAFLTFDDAVIAALVNKLRFNYFYYDAFIALVKMGVIVPAFDGYEEMLVEGSKGEAVSALGNLIQTLDSNGTVFIAARKAFFEYLSFRTQAKLLDAIGDRSASFSRLALSRWSKNQFLSYGRLRNIDSPEDVYETVASRLGADHPLLTRAVLVRRLFDVAAANEKREELAALLGSKPHDYFFTFVDAIIKREASEKWLARVSGEVMEPLLEPTYHHQLLSQIALEMWQSSTTSLRHDILDVIVDLFCESIGKSPITTRQVKERIKQHSLLSVDSGRGNALAFDHQDFHDFFLGEGLGLALSRLSKTEIQSLLSVNIVPAATVEQAVQYLIRHEFDIFPTIDAVKTINDSEGGFTFCKENCGALAMRLAECVTTGGAVKLERMFFSAGALNGRTLTSVEFVKCQFQPTEIGNSHLRMIHFRESEFERLEIKAQFPLKGCIFTECKIDSLISGMDEDQTYEPGAVAIGLQQAGATVRNDTEGSIAASIEIDDRIKTLEKFLRLFLRHTSADEDHIRVRMGKIFAPLFFDQLLPSLLAIGVLEEAPWRGQGVQRRFKLVRPMSEISAALEQSGGTYSGFEAALDRR